MQTFCIVGVTRSDSRTMNDEIEKRLQNVSTYTTFPEPGLQRRKEMLAGNKCRDRGRDRGLVLKKKQILMNKVNYFCSKNKKIMTTRHIFKANIKLNHSQQRSHHIFDIL